MTDNISLNASNRSFHAFDTTGLKVSSTSELRALIDNGAIKKKKLIDVRVIPLAPSCSTVSCTLPGFVERNVGTSTVDG